MSILATIKKLQFNLFILYTSLSYVVCLQMSEMISIFMWSNNGRCSGGKMAKAFVNENVFVLTEIPFFEAFVFPLPVLACYMFNQCSIDTWKGGSD